VCTVEYGIGGVVLLREQIILFLDMLLMKDSDLVLGTMLLVETLLDSELNSLLLCKKGSAKVAKCCFGAARAI
jgi:hypothetical protein